MSKKSYNEVLEILKHIPIKHYFKIPREEISKLILGKDEDYDFTFDKNKDFSEQNISTEACEIFIKLYIKYIADEKQREGIKEMLELNELMNENNKMN